MPKSSATTIEQVRRISREDQLREVLLNLFERMKLEPILSHGPLESGKDVICRERNRFGVHEWAAAVVKVGKITGTTSGSASLQTIMNQVQESFLHPYDHTVLKQAIRINKALVITNDEISDTARTKLLDKLGGMGVVSANVHFVDGKGLASLLDAHWPTFKTERADLMSEADPMSREAGLVLYTVARAHTWSGRKAKKKMMRGFLVHDLSKHTNLGESAIDAAAHYLIQTQYLSKRRGRYSLHPTLTRGRLLTEIDDIRLLFVLETIVDSNNHFTTDSAAKAAHDELSFKKPFVMTALETLLGGDYTARDVSRGKGHYRLNISMLDDEREYLKCWLEFRGARPTQETSKRNLSN